MALEAIKRRLHTGSYDYKLEEPQQLSPDTHNQQPRLGGISFKPAPCDLKSVR